MSSTPTSTPSETPEASKASGAPKASEARALSRGRIRALRATLLLSTGLLPALIEASTVISAYLARNQPYGALDMITVVVTLPFAVLPLLLALPALLRPRSALLRLSGALVALGVSLLLAASIIGQIGAFPVLHGSVVLAVLVCVLASALPTALHVVVVALTFLPDGWSARRVRRVQGAQDAQGEGAL